MKKEGKRILMGMIYQRMLNLAEFEQNDAFRDLYAGIIRRMEREWKALRKTCG